MLSKIDLSRAHDPVAVEARLRRLEREQEIHIHHLGMASGRIVADEASEAAWFCLRIMTGRETAVEKLLKDAGVIVALPMKKPRKVKKRGRVHLLPARPVMPGYMLVKVVPCIAAFVGLIAVKDVIDVVGGAAKPLRIKDGNVKQFMCMATGVLVPSTVGFAKAERVQIAVGPFAEMTGLVARDAAKGDVYGHVTLALNGNSFHVTIPLDFLKKL